MKMYDITNQIPQCNYSQSRDGYKPEAIALHITGDSAEHQTTNWFREKIACVSAHYVIEKNGDTYICVYPQFKAYHCGIVIAPTAQIYFDKGNVNPNKYTIGIECVSSGEPLTQEQITSLRQLVFDLCNTYRIPLNRYHIIGHNELDSVKRRFDPISSYNADIVIPKIEEVVNVTVDEALALQVAAGIINSPEYWKKVVDTTKNFDQYVINVGKKLQELQNGK